MNMEGAGIRIIWIVPKFPLGTPDGARHATRSLVRHLTHSGLTIDLMCVLVDSEPAPTDSLTAQLGVRSCSFVPRSSSKWLPLPGVRTPYTFRTFTARSVRDMVRKELDRLLASADSAMDTFLVFDGLHTFAAVSQSDLDRFSKRCRGIIYRAHNVETALWEQNAERSWVPWFRWFFQYQAGLVRNFESRVAHLVSMVAPVSHEDAVRFKRFAPETVVTVTPIGMDFPGEDNVKLVPDGAKFELLFIGRLDWLPNKAGLVWFLKNVWPSLIATRSEAQLVIAGLGDGRWLQKFKALQGIRLLGQVDNVAPLYASCSLAIAPLFQGSGTRVKILEAARFGRAVITTALGVEGIDLVPGSSYYRAEAREEWLALLGTLSRDDCRKTGLRAFQEVGRNFDAKNIAKKFIQSLENLVPQSQ